jgi:hypothetical protein
MPWTAPKTYVAGAILTAAEKNTYERDNMIMLRAGGFALAGQQANDLMRASGADQWTRIASANNGVLITSGAGVPSIGTTLPNAVQDAITRLGTVTTGSFPAANITGTLPDAVQDLITRLGIIVSASISANLLTAGTLVGDFGTTGGIAAVGEVRTANAFSAAPISWDVGGLATGNLAVTTITKFIGTPTVQQGIHPLYTMPDTGTYNEGRIVCLVNALATSTDILRLMHNANGGNAGAVLFTSTSANVDLAWGKAAIFVLAVINGTARWVQVI